MAEETGIAWTDSTFNAWIGCTKVGPGCDGCYAHVLDARYRWGGAAHWGAGVPRHRTSAGNWHKPIEWNARAAKTGKRWLVFCSSLSDVFDNEAPEEWRADLFALIRSTPALTWQLVTKRIGNALKMLPPDWGAGYPNVWIISTIVNQEEADRDMPKLMAVPAHVHGASYEPALGPVDWSPWFARGLSWVIIGGESVQSGHVTRAFDLGWARSTIAQCRAAGAYPFMKQVGSKPFEVDPDPTHGGFRCGPGYRKATISLPIKDRAGATPEEWPEDLRVREFPA
jgi:protein gp37